jgi:uncharacterized membrane protein
MIGKRFGPLVSWKAIVAGLIAAGIVHIATTLAVPMVATGSAYRRLAAVLPANKMVVLPPVSPENQALPFQQPDARYAVCRFDLTGGPESVSVTLPERGWVLTLHSALGDIFYVAPGQENRGTEISFHIVPATERFFGLLPNARGMDGEGTTVSSPAPRGLAVLRAPHTGEAFVERVEKTLAIASCATDKT